MNKTIRRIIFVCIALVALAGAIIYMILSGRMKPNPPGTVGNTAGNLNNNGLFCEYDGTVFFANAGEGGHLYAMNPDETDVRQINNMNVRNLLVDDSFVYFIQLGNKQDASSGFSSMISVKSFIRSDKKGQNTTSLTDATVLQAQLVDNRLYLLTTGKSLSFQTMNRDKSDKKDLADYEIDPSSVYNGVIYYNGTQSNHYLYGLSTTGNSVSEVWRGNCWYPIRDGDYVYY